MRKFPWPTKKLEDICELIRGSEPGSESYFNEVNEERIRFIRVGDISGKVDQPKFIDKKLSNLVVVNPDEILISFDGTPGIVAKGWSGAIASGIRVIRNIKPEILREFLFYYLQTSQPQEVIKFYTTGVTILHASRAIPYIKIPLPPLKIQQKIVERIEELFEKIDKAKELRQKAQEETEQIFQSALQEIFSKVENKWGLEKLGKISNIFAGSSAPQGQKYFENGKYPFVRVQDLGRCGKTKNLIKIKDKVNNLALKDHHLVFAKKGTILFPKSGAAIFTNSRAILGVDAYIVGHLAAIVPHKSTIMTDWIFYWLYQFDMAELTKTTSLPSLNLSLIKNLEIPLPPLSEQKKIVDYLDDLREKVEKLKQLQQKQLEELNELKNSILDKAFRGELIK